jgi:hypothetical protein
MLCVCVCVRACWRASRAVFRCTDRLLCLSRFNRGFALQEVTHSWNYISFLPPYDIVPKPLMEQKLVRSVPPLKQSFPTIQDIKQSFPSAYCVHLILWKPFRCMLKSVDCIIRHIANVCGWTCTSTEIEYRFFLAFKVVLKKCLQGLITTSDILWMCERIPPHIHKIIQRLSGH